MSQDRKCFHTVMYFFFFAPMNDVRKVHCAPLCLRVRYLQLVQTPSPEEDQGLKCRDCGWSHPERLLQPLPVSATSQDQLHHREWSLPSERNHRRMADAFGLTKDVWFSSH